MPRFVPTDILYHHVSTFWLVKVGEECTSEELVPTVINMIIDLLFEVIFILNSVNTVDNLVTKMKLKLK